MYISDKKVLDYFTIALILCLPWFCTAWFMWGWIWEVIILLSVLWTGLRNGLKSTLIVLIIGYSAAALSFGLPGLQQMGYVPWAGLVAVIGFKNDWSQRSTILWSTAAAGLLGAVPTFWVEGFDSQNQELIDSMIFQYKNMGLLTGLQDQGITESELRIIAGQTLSFYTMIIPGLAALASIFEFGIIYYFFVRWIVQSEKRLISFSCWRLPWYAVWGPIIALGCYLLGDEFSLVLLRGLGLNLLIICGAVALIIGISVYYFFLKSPNVPRLIKWILILGNIFYFMLSLISITLLGLFDLVFNFRRLPEVESGDHFK
ncbi:MAG: DUF2232 domain-containing protein [Desulfitobacteriaceae bacterium]|nr:DUF2232 domain-containing protein [Desulfitobacteriaceae bacterium]MDD4400316.1 DUF2232 domain-containing protein [Desulfitobacteriaceae bacterium]